MSPAEFLTAALGLAVEDARRRRNEAIGRYDGDVVDADFRRVSSVLDRFLAGQARHELSEADLVDLFERVGRSSRAEPKRSEVDEPTYLPPQFR